MKRAEERQEERCDAPMTSRVTQQTQRRNSLFTKIFWTDIEHFIKKKLCIALQLSDSDILINFNDRDIVKIKA